MAHGGTNFGFYNGANTGVDDSDYKPDLTSYDYDAPIKESGDVDNAKFKDVVQSENPISMESVGQMFGFLLYVSEYVGKNRGSSLRIPKVHDRAQVLISCPSGDNGGKPEYVENMGRVNYGQYLFDEKGILSSVYLDGKVLHGWKMYSIPFHNLNEVPKINPIIQVASSGSIQQSARKKLEHKHGMSLEPYEKVERCSIKLVALFSLAFLSFGPQCNLYVPAPILHDGENVVVVFELESPNSELVIHSVDKPDFMCGSSRSNVHQL
ncbi:hypothetical protein Pint_28945 [Pistacia integerrima]|uniref:Uncharacterized protein n=1 Tax=Pistacia integerrima TaxID=434235 RepID=A0ACC0X3H2_9ROSI|nr:hypothetical protein Pint_28945 [Pistacia integerrima]